jgi:hypothetical protein
MRIFQASDAATTRTTVDLAVNEKKCRDMPKVSRINLIQCCSMPELFKTDIKEKCIADCSGADYRSNPWCCMTKCMIEEAELGANGTVDKEKAKVLFKAMFKNNKNRKIAEEAVERCDGAEGKMRVTFICRSESLSPSTASSIDPQTEECDFPEYATVLSCVTNELYRSCPYTVNETTCLQIKNFIRKCPQRRNDLFNV